MYHLFQSRAVERAHSYARQEFLDFTTDVSRLYRDFGHVDGDIPRIELVSPFEWTKWRKRTTLAIACFATIFASVAPSAYSPGEDQMAQEWHVSKVATAVGVTTFTTGFAVAPMAMAPFSEVIGRKPVFLGMGMVYVVCTVCCGATQLYSG